MNQPLFPWRWHPAAAPASGSERVSSDLGVQPEAALASRKQGTGSVTSAETMRPDFQSFQPRRCLSPFATDHTRKQPTRRNGTRRNGTGTDNFTVYKFRASSRRSQSPFPLAVVSFIFLLGLLLTCDITVAQNDAVLAAAVADAAAAAAEVAAADEPAAVIEIDDDTNVAADAIMLDDLPIEEAEEAADDADEKINDRDQWEGRNFEDDEEDVEQAEVRIAPVLLVPNGNGQKVEIDEDDPFAALLKKQPQWGAHVQQTRNAVEAMVGGDFSFAARVCESNDEERAKMRRLARVEIREIMVVVAKQMMAQFGGGPFMRNRDNKSAAEMRKNAVERVLTGVYWTGKANGQEKPSQIKKWETAHASREKYANEAYARVFVGALSQQLYLDKPQREALTESIADCWKEEWLIYIDNMIHNPEYFPSLPSKAIKPHVSDEQYQLWKDMPKSQFGTNSQWRMGGNTGLFVRNDGKAELNAWFHDDDEIEKAEDADKPEKGMLGQLNAALRRAADGAKAKEDKEGKKEKVKKQPREKEDNEPVSLHKLGLLGMGSGASIIKQAIEDGSDVDEVAEGGITPLHVAAVNGAEKNVKLLLESGADPSKKNRKGKTPADLARDHDYEKIAKRLDKATEDAK